MALEILISQEILMHFTEVLQLDLVVPDRKAAQSKKVLHILA
jgi:hypothetical protein